MTKIGIISFAHMHASGYARSLRELPQGQLAGIWDDDSQRGQKMAEKLSSRFYPSLDDLLAADIQGVIITSPNADHRQHAEAAARAKKHILSEKPIASTLEDAQAMIDAAKEAGVHLGTAFPCRHILAAKRLKELVAGGDLGEILAVKGTNRGTMPGGWFTQREKSGGGAVMDHTVHIADLLRFLLEDEVKTVYAEVDNKFYNMDIDDCGTLILEFNRGTIGSHDPSWSKPNKAYPTWGDVTLKIVGTEGTVEMDSLRQRIEVYSDEKIKTVWNFWGESSGLAMVADFISAIEEDREPAATGFDGLKALEVALAAYKSAETGEPVELPLK